MLQTFLRKSKNARKVFGKKELEIIFKQNEGFPLTQSQKNRLSRDIRPKFRFIKEVSQFESEFELKKDANTTSIVNKVVDIILRDEFHERILAILLFGSHVNGIVTPRSDIDICVVFNHISLEEATKFRIRVSGEFSVKTDIQVFNILPQKIKRSIAKNHQVIYKKSQFNNLTFTIQYLKDDDFFRRLQRIKGVP